MYVFSSDETVIFKNNNDENAYCRLRIYSDADKTLALISQMHGSNGSQEVNLIEKVITEILLQKRLMPSTTQWIHHCPEGLGMWFGREDFHRIPVSWDGSRYSLTTSHVWPQLSRQEVEELIPSFS